MRKEIQIQGKIIPGRGEAKGFLQLDWVREQCLEKAGFEPYPGTLNLKVTLEDFNYMRKLSCSKGVRLIPPVGHDEFCEARLIHVKAGGVDSAVVFPMVDNYYPDILEIIAPVGLKGSLGLSDNDQLLFSVDISQKLPLPEGIIFDLDGTLIDSVDLYYSILCEGCSALGLTLPERENVLEIMGKGLGFWEAWEELVLRTNTLAEKEGLRKSFIDILEKIWEERYDREVKFFPGIVPFLSNLQQSGMPMGVVTSSFYSKKMNIFIENNLAPDLLFKSIITRRDTVKNKPNPEPLQLCLQQMQVQAEKCLCVGDSPCDIAAGRDAGMFTVGVLTGTGTRQSLSKEGADVILDEVTELLEIFDL